MTRCCPLGKATTRVVVITGGSSGIGRCTAILFAQRGWRIGLIARGEQGLAASRRDVEAARRLSGAPPEGARRRSRQQIPCQAANAIVAVLGPIDAWINCAGGNGVYGRLEDVSEEEFRRVTDVTYHGTVNGTRVALSHMRKRGRGGIVNVCSAIAFHGLPLMSSYAGAKAAVRAFGQVIRGELRLERSAVRISTVFPPAVNTPFFSHAISHMGWPARPARPVYQPEVVGAGDMAGDGERAGGNDHHRYGGDFLAGDEARAGSDGLVCRTNGVRATVDPRARGLRSPGDDLVRTLAARVHRARAVRTTGTRMERTAFLKGGLSAAGNLLGEGMARRYVKRSVACQTRSKSSRSKAWRFGGTARRLLR